MRDEVRLIVRYSLDNHKKSGATSTHIRTEILEKHGLSKVGTATFENLEPISAADAQAILTELAKIGDPSNYGKGNEDLDHLWVYMTQWQDHLLDGHE